MRAVLTMPAIRRARGRDLSMRVVPQILGALLVVGVTVLFTGHVATESPLYIFVGLVATAVPAWLITTSRTFEGLCVILLYVACLDGFLKLKFGYGSVTIVRDILMFALAFGVVIRAILVGDKTLLPPATLLVMAWVILVVVCVLNPGTASIKHGVFSLRQHIEFVPLFFLTFLTVTTSRRLRTLMLVLVVAGGLNGAVTLYQSTLTPREIASWGPGYAEKYQGGSNGALTPRTFDPGEADARIRPPGLGGDAGAGAAWAGIGLLALIGLVQTRKTGRYAPLIVGAFFILAAGVVAGQSRTALLSTVFAVVLTAVAFSSRRGSGKLLVSLGTACLAAYLVVLAITSLTGMASFSRYDSISPANVVDTTISRGSIADVPRYAVRFPLGAGLGVAGPTSGATPEGALRSQQLQLNAEGQYVFLIDEVGIAGLLLMVAVFVTFMRMAVGLRSLSDPDIRPLLAVCFGVLVLMLAVTWAGSFTAVPPGSIVFWIIGGVLAAWTAQASRGRVAETAAPDRHRPALPA